ncbi:MAG: hypothetical protein EOO73_06590 [Myxococcales bacterium]|nr:MAG: hypothetical protein EOO73_06590 [Myxococcales bacterium]
MTVSLVEIFAAARAHAAPLAAESAGYLLLGIADHVVSAPRVVAAEEVELSSDGVVRLRPNRGAIGTTDGAEANVRRLLARALEVSSSVGPGLRRAAERTEETGLTSLVRELEVALIPVNRSAAKRALSRLHRETERARDAGKLESLLHAEPAMPVVSALEAREVPVAAAEAPEPSPARLPIVRSAPPPVTEAPPVPRVRPPAPVVELTLTPEPQLAVGEPALTKPEPVVVRARERGSSTPRLGTLVTAQTLAGEEQDLTERVPEVEEELEIAVELSLEEDVTPALPSKTATVAMPEPEPEREPWSDPEPSRLPDVLTAMVELHTGLDSDEAPTRLREVVTELREEPEPALVVEAPRVAAEPIEFWDPLVALQEMILVEPIVAMEPSTPEPQQVEDTWLTASSLEGVVSAPSLFVSERVDPELHDALTWNPGPVVVSLPSPLPPALLMAEPVLEPSPYAPAVLPLRTSEVSELLDSFYVSGAAEEQELRSALKEMAGLELTPAPHPLRAR